MPPSPTNMGAMLPPVLDSICRKSNRKLSISGPSYVIEERKRSSSLASLLAEEDTAPIYNLTNIKKVKSKSVMHLKLVKDDLTSQNQQYKHSEHSSIERKKELKIDYNRVLQEEQKEFEFRLKNIPKASGQLDDFRIIKKLASGNFGRVYLAEDLMDKKQYAIKTISKESILRNNLLAEVEAERDYLYATNSSFIVSLVQHFEDSDRVYFVEEYVSNGDIYEHLNYNGPFSEDLTRFYAAQLVLALEYMHNVNLIYRDLKPENVMIDSNGYVKLVDFGLVKRVERKTNTMVGTPAYLAPEMILHKPYDKTVDWWSLGILIYEMLAGCQITPFAHSNRMTMYEKITSDKEITFPPSSRFPHTVVKDLIRRLLKTNPAIRLGGGVNGSQDVKSHPWFTSIKWLELYRRNLNPPARRSSKHITKSNYSANITIQQSANKFQKVSALKQSLLGTRAPTNGSTGTIQNRLRLEKILKIR